jgi:hypothetical protein
VRKNIKFLSTSVFTLNISVRLGIGELRVMWVGGGGGGGGGGKGP